MSNTIRHKRLTGAPSPSDPDVLGGPDWDAEHVIAGGTDGAIAIRDVTATDGINWLDGVDGAQTIVSRGTNRAPQWSTQLDIGGVSAANINGTQVNATLLNVGDIDLGGYGYIGLDPDLSVPVARLGQRFGGTPPLLYLFTDVQAFADNAAAIAGGLPVGAIYRTGDLLKIVH